MTRGYSLEKDLKLLLNNPKYSDIEILCEDGKILYGCRAILAVRSEVFDGLLYNGMKESYEKQISFPTINSTTMEIILEYAYTGLIKDESLTEDNIIEAFNAADFFQLISLQDVIMKRFHTFLRKKEYIPELLSKAVETMPLSEDNILLNLLVEALATIPLNTIKFDRISITALEYFLCYTHEIKKPFVTPEYEVFRYSAILAAKQVSDDSYKTIMKRLPTLEQIESSIKVENEIITKQQEIIEALKPLLRFIDFKRIKEQIITDIIEPLGITSNVKIDKYKLTSNLYSTRGTTSYMPVLVYIWDKSTCGSKLDVVGNGKLVRALNNCDSHQSVRTTILLEDKGIFEWDIIVEKVSIASWIGVCSSEHLNHENFSVDQPTVWALSSFGYCYHCNKSSKYCSTFEDGAKITVHINMNERTCAFTVNGTKYPEISGWNNLPSKLYLMVGLKYPGSFRIQAYREV